MLRWGLVMIVVCGCYSPVVPSGVPCGVGDVCPVNQRCVADRCVVGDGDPDAAPGDGVAVPDTVDAPPGLGWTVPIRVAEISTSADDFGPSLFANQQRIYVANNTIGGFRIYYASRASVMQPFSAPLLADELDLAGDEYDPEVSAAGLELHHASSDLPTGIRQTTRAITSTSWTTPPTILAGLRERVGPSLAVTDSRMVVSIRMIGGIEEYGRASSSGAGAWTLLRSHASLSNFVFPGLGPDGLEIYATNKSTGGLFRATRATIDDQFGTPVRVLFGGAVDGSEIYDPELTVDGRTMYLAIDAGNGFDIYVTTR